MTNRADAILNDVFGYDSWRGRQGEIVETLCAGDDALVLMPTGGGKSLCYQVPALVRPGAGVVISPLISLMTDQVAALVQLGVRAAALNSTLSRAQAARVESDLREGRLDLVYLSPERLLNPGTLNLLDQCELALFAIDEAHCVSRWGHDFRREYLALSVLHERYPHVPRVALTATADDKTRREIVERLDLGSATQFVDSFDRPNIFYRITEGADPKHRLFKFINERHPGTAGIVYCLSRKKVEQTAAWLSERGREALPYHAGLAPEVRHETQSRFIAEDGLIVVATIAFGMGIDKPDVRFVAHLDLPASIESYYQETGRAGRDGLAADAWMAYGLGSVITLRRMLEMSEADEERKRLERVKLDAMLGLCEMTACRRQALLAYFGEQMDEPCGHCDNCVEPRPTWDATEAAQQALSCAYRTDQRFGVNYLIDVLTGRQNERIARFGHDRLKVFGIGKDLPAPEWRRVFRQLTALGLLSTDDQYGSLRLTAAARPVLRGERRLTLAKAPPRRKARRTTAPDAALASVDPAVWESLRELRMALARDQGVPPYVIFNDRTLTEMIRRNPATLDELADVPGVGQVKLERYGRTFLEALRRTEDDQTSAADSA